MVFYCAKSGVTVFVEAAVCQRGNSLIAHRVELMTKTGVLQSSREWGKSLIEGGRERERARECVCVCSSFPLPSAALRFCGKNLSRVDFRNVYKKRSICAPLGPIPKIQTGSIFGIMFFTHALTQILLSGMVLQVEALAEPSQVLQECNNISFMVLSFQKHFYSPPCLMQEHYALPACDITCIII